MTAVLKSIDDPRGPADKIRRIDLARFAETQGIKAIPFGANMLPVADAPAMITRKFLASKGLLGPLIRWAAAGNAVPSTISGPPGSAVAPAPQVQAAEVDFEADLMRQFSQPQPVVPATPSRPIGSLQINELRKECQSRGIKLSRRDNMTTMRQKIEEHDRNAH